MADTIIPNTTGAFLLEVHEDDDPEASERLLVWRYDIIGWRIDDDDDVKPIPANPMATISEDRNAVQGTFGLIHYQGDDYRTWADFEAAFLRNMERRKVEK